MDKDELRAKLEQWDFALNDVPTRYLGLSFERAIRSHTSQGPFTPAEVIREYGVVQQELRQGTLSQGTLDAVNAGIDWLKLNPPEGAVPPKREGYIATGPYYSLTDWKVLHNLPHDWKLGDPYPKESDLYGKGVPRLSHGEPFSKEHIDNLHEQNPNWLDAQKAPWELYPDAEHPEVKEVVVVKTVTDEWGGKHKVRERQRNIYWVDRCTEIDFPEVECPGYVLEHYGPEGKWERKLPCPLHRDRNTGGR